MSASEIRVRLIEGFLSVAVAGNHSVTIDRPASAGGTEAGFRAGELTLVSLGGCLSSTLAGVAQARGITLEKVEIRVSGKTIPNPDRFGEFEVLVELLASNQAGEKLSDEELDKLLQIAERGCFITNTLKAGATVTVQRVLPTALLTY